MPPLIAPPPLSAPGVKRFNRVPYFVAAGFVLVGMSAVGYTFYLRHEATMIREAEEQSDKKPKGGKPPVWMEWGADHGAIQATVTKPDDHGEIPVQKAAFAPTAPPAQQGPPQPPAGGTSTQSDLQEQARARAWALYYQQMEQVKMQQFQTDLQRRKGGQQADQQAQAIQSSARQAAVDPATGEAIPGNGISTGGVDATGQTGKQAFLRQPGDPYGINENTPGSVHKAKPNTIMEGTAVPGRLVEAATSDSPGQLVAEVATNVFDDMTGAVLLIPQFTRIVTTYDIAVSMGQERIGVVAQRLIFPDTSSRQLGTMQVADQAGRAGLTDIVKTHFWEKFWATAVISIAGAGAQLAQPQQSAFSGYSPSSVAIGQLTQGFSQLGQSIAQRMLSIPNTIELRTGLPLVIKFKDLTLPPYVDSRR